jgi:hypothetical protein
MPTTIVPDAAPTRVAPERQLVVALDIGKDVHVVYARTAASTDVLPPTKLQTLACGFQTLTTHLDAWLSGGDYDQIIFGHEPTGVYHDAWSAALIARYQPHLTGPADPPLIYRLLVPNQVKAERERRSHRRRKTDAIDAAAIAALLAEGQGTPHPMLPAAEQELRLRLSQVRRLAKQQIRLQVDLLRTLDRLWPGALGNQRRYQAAHPDLPPLLHLVDTHPQNNAECRIENAELKACTCPVFHSHFSILTSPLFSRRAGAGDHPRSECAAGRPLSGGHWRRRDALPQRQSPLVVCRLRPDHQ